MWNEIVSLLTGSRPRALGALLVLATLNVFLFGALGARARSPEGAAVSFLDVGQGDAALVTLGGEVQILIDGGPPHGQLLEELGALLPPTDRTIELVVLTHPELDHYGGLIDLLRRYEVGAFVDTGVGKEVDAYRALLAAMTAAPVRRITLRAGDRIRYGDSRFTVFSPDDRRAAARAKNDTSLVLALETGGARFLFTGDISAEVERALIPFVEAPFDVLKVAHHGSKFSSDAGFLTAVRPAVAVIEVGKNSYGHPTRETLGRLEDAGARIYRTDRHGTVTVRVGKGELQVFADR